MLFNTSYKNEEYIKESNRMVGKPYSFFEKLKLRGVGSRRLVVEELNPALAPKHMQKTDTSYASVELRPKGIIIHFSNRLDRYSWLIPYYRVVIFSTETFSIHSNGKFIKFKKDRYYRENKAFITKMINLKNARLTVEFG